MQFFGEQRENESAELNKWREAASGNEAEDNALCESSLRRLVEVLIGGERAFRRGEGADTRIKRAVYAWLVKRCGELPEFKEIKPAPPKIAGLLVNALLFSSMRCEAEAKMLLDLSNEIEARASPGQGGKS